MFDNTGKFLYKIGEQGEGDGQLSGLTDCVLRNVAITIIFLFVIEPMAVLISLQWRAVSLLLKLLLSYKTL